MNFLWYWKIPNWHIPNWNIPQLTHPSTGHSLRQKSSKYQYTEIFTKAHEAYFFVKFTNRNHIIEIIKSGWEIALNLLFSEPLPFAPDASGIGTIFVLSLLEAGILPITGYSPHNFFKTQTGCFRLNYDDWVRKWNLNEDILLKIWKV